VLQLLHAASQAPGAQVVDAAGQCFKRGYWTRRLLQQSVCVSAALLLLRPQQLQQLLALRRLRPSSLWCSASSQVRVPEMVCCIAQPLHI
jgi:hypothetical protein